MSVEVTREDGSVVAIRRKFAEGGQGIVYLVAPPEDNPKATPMLAKIYRQPSELQAQRVKELIHRRNERLEQVAAWPAGLIYDPDGRAIGFEMPQVVNAVPLYAAYQIRSRLMKLPGRDYKFLVRAARNLAAALHHVHEAGLVVGDLNESNVLVDGEAMVKLIDSDSYQVRVDGEIVTCDVGKSELIAPELQGRSLTNLVRTPDHDRFSLAVLVFHLLVLGRHPFAGIPKGKDELTLEEAILNGWYPFELDRGGPLLPPPGLTLEWLPDDIREHFRRAFDPLQEGCRPTAQDWFGSLKTLESSLETCTDNPRHVFPGAADKCPWCRLEEHWRVTLFGAAQRPGEVVEDIEDDPDFDLEAIWKQITSVPPPVTPERPAIPELCDLPSANLPARERVLFLASAVALPVAASAGLLWAGIQIGAICVIWGVIFRGPAAWLCGLGPRVRRSRRAFVETKQQIAELIAEWELKVSPKAFTETVDQLDSLRRRYRDLATRADQLRYQALSREHGAELQAYLHRYPVTTADVMSLSNSQAFHLDNVGVHTAADVSPESLERHCPPELREDLMNWRRSLELHFWNSSMYVPSPSAEMRIRKEISKERNTIRVALERGPQALHAMRTVMQDSEQELRERLEALMPIYNEVGGRHKTYSALVGRTD